MGAVARPIFGSTAQFTATGSGFSIQPADQMGFTPIGFDGLCLYPNSVFAAVAGPYFGRLEAGGDSGVRRLVRIR